MTLHTYTYGRSLIHIHIHTILAARYALVEGHIREKEREKEREDPFMR